MNRVDKLFNVAWVDTFKKFNREGEGRRQKILEDPLSIERLKGVKTLCTFNVMNCV